MLTLFIFFSLIVSASSETMCVGGGNFVGPVFPGLVCPPGTIATDDDICCDPAGVQEVEGGEDATTAAPIVVVTEADGSTRRVTVSTISPGGNGAGGDGSGGVTSGVLPGNNGSSTCVDKLNPRTGTSDCRARAAYCNDPLYNIVMNRECPRTCNRCSSVPTTVTGGCVDRVNPKTGTSDCPAKVAYCSDPVYYAVMTQECPKTCNRCIGTRTARKIVIGSSESESESEEFD